MRFRLPFRSARVADERVSSTSSSPWRSEHRARYRFATFYCHRARVLDIACGSGLGLDLLLQAEPNFIVAADRSTGALKEARKTVADDLNVLMLQADALKIPARDGSIDTIISFETVEHLTHQQDFVSECRRVLHDDGVLLLSTPDARYSEPLNGIPKNPYHTREFGPLDLVTLLSVHFSSVELRLQRTSVSWGPSPFWDKREWLREDGFSAPRLLLWQIQNRLPHSLKDGLSQIARKRPFYPTDYDFDFVEDWSSARGHVLLAICRP